MMKLSELEPWKSLAVLMDKKVEVALSATKTVLLPVYSHGEMPNTGLDDGFIVVANNGSVRNLTIPYGLFEGKIAITVYVRTNADGTVKTNRIRSVIGQIEALVNDKVSDDGKYFYRFSANSIITPWRVNASNGYSLTVLNVEWHTT